MQKSARRTKVENNQQNTIKTVCKTLTSKQIFHSTFKKKLRGTNVSNNQTEHIQNSAQDTDVPYNEREHMENSVLKTVTS